MNYQEQVDDPNQTNRPSQMEMEMDEKESVISEGTIQSSAISQERNQKINDQFQKKKLEFYKMYNKTPQAQPVKDQKPRAKPPQSQPVSYKVSSDRNIKEAMEIARQQKEAEENAAIEAEKEYLRQQEELKKQKREEIKNKKKEDKKEAKDYKKAQTKKFQEEDKKQKEEMKQKERASKVERKDMTPAEKKAEKERIKEEKMKINKDREQQAKLLADQQRQEQLDRMRALEEAPDDDELIIADGDLQPTKATIGEKIARRKRKADKFCSKFCFTLWILTPSIVQTCCLYLQEMINIYIVGRSGDFVFVDVVAMSNILLYFGVFGTAIVFNSVLETLVPHALATNRVELAGHILNRGLFIWSVLFGGFVALAFNSGLLLTQLLGQDEEDAYLTQEYLIHLLPSLWFWGICDAYRRFFNSFHKFWTPCLTYVFTIVVVHPIACYQAVEVYGMGAKGLALAGFGTNFLTYLILRVISHTNVRMRPASFFPTFKTCCNICQYLYYGIPQLIMFWIDTWQWQLLAFVTGWFGTTDQYTTIMLLGATFFCCLVGYSLASAGATLVGQEVGCANITAAKYYYRSMLIVQILLTIALCMGLQILMGFFLDAVTDDVNMQDTILTVYQLWIFNIFLDNIRAMLKGFLRGLGIQNSVLPYHILVQGGCMPGGIFVLCFNLPAFEEVPILGAWISSSGCNFLLFVAYFTTIQRANWHEIGVKVVKRVNAIAGNRADDEEDFLDDGEAAGEIEMHKGLQ